MRLPQPRQARPISTLCVCARCRPPAPAEACNAADRRRMEPSRSLFASPPSRRRLRANVALAREHDEFRVAAGFATEALVGDHQRRAWNQEFADAVDRLLRNLDA